MPIEITEKATKEIKRIIAEQNNDEKAYLRLRVLGGGCSGFQTKLDLDPSTNPEKDEIFELNEISVVVDKRSLLYLQNVSIDFHNDLNKYGFIVSNLDAKSTCGCGSSWS